MPNLTDRATLELVAGRALSDDEWRDARKRMTREQRKALHDLRGFGGILVGLYAFARAGELLGLARRRR